jgi:hypothetical protein
MEQYLRSTKGRTLTRMVGERHARRYWRQRQASMWSSRGLVIATVYAFVAAAVWRTLMSFWVFVGAAVVAWVLPFVYVMTLGWTEAARLARMYGVRYFAAANMPMGEPERLPDWARSNNARHVYPLESEAQKDAAEDRAG